MNKNWKTMFQTELFFHWEVNGMSHAPTWYAWRVCGCRGTTPWLPPRGRRCSSQSGCWDVWAPPTGQRRTTWCSWWRRPGQEPTGRLQVGALKQVIKWILWLLEETHEGLWPDSGATRWKQCEVRVTHCVRTKKRQSSKNGRKKSWQTRGKKRNIVRLCCRLNYKLYVFLICLSLTCWSSLKSHRRAFAQSLWFRVSIRLTIFFKWLNVQK